MFAELAPWVEIGSCLNGRTRLPTRPSPVSWEGSRQTFRFRINCSCSHPTDPGLCSLYACTHSTGPHRVCIRCTACYCYGRQSRPPDLFISRPRRSAPRSPIHSQRTRDNTHTKSATVERTPSSALVLHPGDGNYHVAARRRRCCSLARVDKGRQCRRLVAGAPLWSPPNRFL